MLLYIATLLLVATSVCAEDPRVKAAFSNIPPIANMIPENYLRIFFANGKEAELGNSLDRITVGLGPVAYTTANFTDLHTRITVVEASLFGQLLCKGGLTLVEMTTNIVGGREGTTGHVVVPWLLPEYAWLKRKFVVSLTLVHRRNIEQDIWTKTSENLSRGCFFINDFIRDYGVRKVESGNFFNTRPLISGK